MENDIIIFTTFMVNRIGETVHLTKKEMDKIISIVVVISSYIIQLVRFWEAMKNKIKRFRRLALAMYFVIFALIGKMLVEYSYGDMTHIYTFTKNNPHMQILIFPIYILFLVGYCCSYLFLGGCILLCIYIFLRVLWWIISL